MVDNIRYRKTSHLKFVLQRPQVVLRLDPEGYVIKDERPTYRAAMLLISYRFNARPLKEGDEVSIRNLEEVLTWNNRHEYGEKSASVRDISPKIPRIPQKRHLIVGVIGGLFQP